MTILDAIRQPDLFGAHFRGASWSRWLVALAAIFALPMTEAQLAVFRHHTGREQPPPARVREGWLIVGRRGGKSYLSALCAVWLAIEFILSRAHVSLAPGERATIMVLAADRRQAAVAFRYVCGLIESSQVLAREVTSRTAEAIELGRVAIEVHAASFRSVRGYTLLGVICDEIAFWRSEESANPDIEILNALRPGLVTLPGSLLLGISSPYARRGALWNAYKAHYGRESEVLCWRGTTREMNASVPQSVVDDALAEDEPRARAEYLAEFRTDVETFIPRESVQACVVPGRFELGPLRGHRYEAFVDPSGGSSDSMTLAIGHREGDIAVVDAIRERKPPFSPEAVVAEFATLLDAYRIWSVTGDRYAGEWPRERFRAHRIRYDVAEKAKSELYGALLPALNGKRIELLDDRRLVEQIVGLERRTTRAGRDTIDHPPGRHDDVANALAGVVDLLLGRRIVGGIEVGRF